MRFTKHLSLMLASITAVVLTSCGGGGGGGSFPFMGGGGGGGDGTTTVWKSVAASTHTLALKTDGTLWAWGNNDSGQVGNGTTTALFYSPVQITTATIWKSISAGNNHSVAVRTDGTLWAWGSNSNGQIGNGSSASVLSPLQLGTDTNWASVAAGGNHTVAIKTDGTLWAWGENTFGELGTAPTTTESQTPLQVGSDTNWASVAAGGNHTVAIKTDGTLWAWGGNYYGQVGNGVSGMGAVEHAPVQIGSDTDWASITAGEDHTLAIKKGGTLWGWGYNSLGQVGNGTTGITVSSPVSIGTDTNWKQAAAGSNTTNAVKTDGTLWAWGYNGNGNLGNGPSYLANSPERVGTATYWASTAAGVEIMLAITTEGKLWTVGNDSHGQLGHVPANEQKTPVRLGSDYWHAAAVGSDHTVAVKADGTLWAWGGDGSGQLGKGYTTSPHPGPDQIGTETDWVSALAGNNYTLALKSDLTLSGCGSNASGQLAQGNTSNVEPLISIATGTTWASVSAGTGHVVAIKSDNTLWAWGENGSGQIGNRSYIDALVSVQVGTPTWQWHSAAAGASHTAAVKSDNTLWAWGSNDHGQLGNDSINGEWEPIQIGSETTWASVAAGGNHTMAIKTDGTLWAWGVNTYGELGTAPTTTESHIPRQIGTDTNWKTAVAGESYNLALKADGTLWAWGYNADGQLGNGTLADAYTPVQIGTDTNWQAVSARSSHSVGVKTDQTLWVWGSNPSYGLGFAIMGTVPY